MINDEKAGMKVFPGLAKAAFELTVDVVAPVSRHCFLVSRSFDGIWRTSK